MFCEKKKENVKTFLYVSCLMTISKVKHVFGNFELTP